MPNALTWHQIGEKKYEVGVDKGVLYPAVSGAYPKGVAWNGLTAVNESPSGAEANDSYADNVKYATVRSTETYSFTIEAYQSPKEFDACDGSTEVVDGVSIGQQTRQGFGFSYRSLIGNDTDGTDYGYKLHLVYGCTASPSSRDHGTVNESVELGTLSWEVSTNPVAVTGYSKPTATITIDSTTCDPTKLAALEKILYGSASADARLPLPDEVISIISGTSGSQQSGS